MAEGEHLSPEAIVQRLREQNKKLQSEYNTLSEALTKALAAQKPARPKRAIAEDVNDPKYQEIQNLMKEVKRNQTNIGKLRMQLNAQSEQHVTDLQNDLHYQRVLLKQVTSDHNSLQKTTDRQKQALEALQNGQDYLDKIQTLDKELKTQKDQYREFKAKFVADQAAWRRDHDKMMNTEKRVRQTAKRAAAPGGPDAAELEAQLASFAKKLAITEKAVKTEENKRRGALAQVQARLKTLQQEHNEIPQQMKQYEEDNNARTLKISELRRQVRNLQAQVQRTGPSMDFQFATEPGADLPKTNKRSPNAGPAMRGPDFARS